MFYMNNAGMGMKRMRFDEAMQNFGAGMRRPFAGKTKWTAFFAAKIVKFTSKYPKKTEFVREKSKVGREICANYLIIRRKDDIM